MFASSENLHADEGAGIAEDRRARVLRRVAWPAAALATAGLIAWLGGCSPDVSGVPAKSDVQGGPELPEDAAPLGGFEAVDDGNSDISFTRSVSSSMPDGVASLDGRGYARSVDEHGPDFTVSYEYRFSEAGSMPEDERQNCNTGCLLFITGEDKVWPRCLEVQGKWSETASIKSNARDVTVETTLDERARDAARKPPGEWNQVKIVSRGGALTVSLNGVQVATSEPTELTRGRIGFQAEGFPVEFRNVRIEE